MPHVTEHAFFGFAVKDSLIHCDEGVVCACRGSNNTNGVQVSVTLKHS